MDTKIKPIEDFVFEGLSRRIQQVFSCICIYTTANDKTKALARVFEGKPVEYPYMFIVPQTLGSNTESYTTNLMGRRGLTVTVGEDFTHNARIMPANFDFEIEYITNKFQTSEQGSVMSFARRWLFARRLGYLKFNVKYGKLDLPCSSLLSDGVVLPQLENKVEQESAYKVNTTITVHGYISEPELGTSGIITELSVNGNKLNSDGSVQGAQFFPFN